MDTGEGRHRPIRRNIQVHRSSKNQLPGVLEGANEVRKRLPHGRGGAERNGGRRRMAARGSHARKEAPRDETPAQNKGPQGTRRVRPKRENKKSEPSLKVTRKIRQSKESNVGEPRKKGKKAIEGQNVGAAEQVPVPGKQGQEPVNRAGLSCPAFFARKGSLNRGPNSVGASVNNTVQHRRPGETHYVTAGQKRPRKSQSSGVGE